eukprot:GFYU01000975.1.p1 GENE.GFYU01000975.1~~GFYU01000975.1.p1  ORF type:complete len:446 (+),score=106.77 GFYU01000975.1:47-1384(+)
MDECSSCNAVIWEADKTLLRSECGHVFCALCVDKIKQELNSLCPTCDQPLKLTQKKRDLPAVSTKRKVHSIFGRQSLQTHTYDGQWIPAYKEWLAKQDKYFCDPSTDATHVLLSIGDTVKEIRAQLNKDCPKPQPDPTQHLSRKQLKNLLHQQQMNEADGPKGGGGRRNRKSKKKKQRDQQSQSASQKTHSNDGEGSVNRCSEATTSTSAHVTDTLEQLEITSDGDTGADAPESSTPASENGVPSSNDIDVPSVNSPDIVHNADQSANDSTPNNITTTDNTTTNSAANTNTTKQDTTGTSANASTTTNANITTTNDTTTMPADTKGPDAGGSSVGANDVESKSRSDKRVTAQLRARDRQSALKALTLLEGDNRNWDAKNQVDARDIMRYLWRYVKKYGDISFRVLLYEQLGDIVRSGSCPQGRTTRVWQIASSCELPESTVEPSV